MERDRRATLGTVVPAVLGATIVGAADWWLPAPVALGILHVLPVGALAWRGMRGPALALAGVAAVNTLGSDLHGLAAGTPPWVPFANTLLLSLLLGGAAFAADAAEVALEAAGDDDVTGIANRTGFHEAAAAELSRSRRYHRPLAVAELRVDGYHDVAARGGRAAAEALQRSVALSLRGSVRGNDVVARLDGGHFGILLPETGGDSALVAARRIQDQLRADRDRTRWPVDFTLGCASFERPPDTADEVVHAAGDALDEARRQGPGTVLHRAQRVAGAP